MKGPRHSSPCQTKGKEHPPVAPQGSAKPELPEPRATVDTEKKFSVPVPQALIFCSVWLSCSFHVPLVFSSSEERAQAVADQVSN